MFISFVIIHSQRELNSTSSNSILSHGNFLLHSAFFYIRILSHVKIDSTLVEARLIRFPSSIIVSYPTIFYDLRIIVVEFSIQSEEGTRMDFVPFRFHHK